MFSNRIIGNVLQDRFDYYIKQGVYVEAVAVAIASDSAVPRVVCRNYGCGKKFVESENGPTACRHHVAPPLFHDCVKGWTCCKDRKAYDWEEFQKIEGCSIGPHSTIDPKELFAKSPNAPSGASSAPADLPAPPVLKSISSYNSENPDAATASASAVKLIQTRKSTRKEDGTAKCLNKGCQQIFLVSSNGPRACTYHRGQPIFHDAAKFWSCCSDKKCYDFEEFMQVRGCINGYHDDGEIDVSALQLADSSTHV